MGSCDNKSCFTASNAKGKSPLIASRSRIRAGIKQRSLREIDKRITALSDKVTSVAKANEENNIRTARVRILRFGDELLNDVSHSKDSFDQAMMDVDLYTRYCHTHPDFQNGIAGSMAEYIREQYNANLRNHGFANPKEGKKNES